MAIYEFSESKIREIEKTTFAERGIRERQDIQRLLREQIEIILDETLVLTEEFGEWDASRRRIDLLCLDKEANLVVVELKRTEDGGHMDLQSIRYGAMVSTMTFEQATDIHGEFLMRNGSKADARQSILEFLEWEGPDEDVFAQDVRMVLVSAEFSKELTTSVLWLNDKGIDIRCIKMEPYYDGQKTLLDIQQVIPLPEAEQYQIRVRRKKTGQAPVTPIARFTLSVAGEDFAGLNKRNLMYRVVCGAIGSGIAPEDLEEAVDWRTLFAGFDGILNGRQMAKELNASGRKGSLLKSKRYFCKRDELFFLNGRTYALTNQWGVRTEEAVERIGLRFPQLKINFERE